MALMIAPLRKGFSSCLRILCSDMCFPTILFWTVVYHYVLGFALWNMIFLGFVIHLQLFEDAILALCSSSYFLFSINSAFSIWSSLLSFELTVIFKKLPSFKNVCGFMLYGTPSSPTDVCFGNLCISNLAFLTTLYLSQNNDKHLLSTIPNAWCELCFYYTNELRSTYYYSFTYEETEYRAVTWFTYDPTVRKRCSANLSSWLNSRAFVSCLEY